MTYIDLIKKLEAAGADAPESEATEIVRALCGRSREWCLLNRTAELSDSVDSAVAKRESGIPLQYILGEAWFYGNRFIVSPDCLIPQPDTEHLVHLGLKHIKNGGKLLDLCTGSGCIAVSLLKESENTSAVAVDISEGALDIARKNADLHGVGGRIIYMKQNVLADPIEALIADADVILSNPPYINTDVIPTLSKEVQNEPHIALDGGSDGMTFYNHFIINLTKHMKPQAVMLLEIGYDQGAPVSALCEKEGLSYKIHKDFGGNDRVCEISRGKPPKNE